MLLHRTPRVWTPPLMQAVFGRLFLPCLIDLSGRGSLERDFGGLHTLYISPMKALAVDIARNRETPVREMALDISCETRTGDTPHAKRTRQRKRPPVILMTTPVSLSLLLTYADAARLFGRLRCLILDELHAIMPSKRGDLSAVACTSSLDLGIDWAMSILSSRWVRPRAPAACCSGLAGPITATTSRARRSWRRSYSARQSTNSKADGGKAATEPRAETNTKSEGSQDAIHSV